MKLEIFRISLKKPGGSKTDLHNYDEFFKDAFKKDASEEAYQEFIKEFIAYFKNEFMLNRDGSKAISTNHRSRFIHRSNKNIIDGELIGGNTGIPQVIYNQKDSNNNTGDISEDEVSTLPFYFKIWTPPNHNTGVLMIQSYSQQTVTFLVRLHLAKFFKKYDFSIIISPFVPNKLKEYFKKRSKVYKVAFVKESLNRNKRKPMFK